VADELVTDGERQVLVPELWGGIECTLNRVADSFIDQLDLNGRGLPLSDLDRVAELGLRALRMPILWEKVAPRGVARADWTWVDERVARLRELELRTIAGLMHHGGGPTYTCLIDPAFPTKLAEYARAAAQRYPFILDWTPINEIVTTARFSCLYGIWHPHTRDTRIFILALLNECRATSMAMAAIREIIPRARLVYTDDFGRIGSVPELAYQAEYENQRRLLGVDLLTARVTPQHPLWPHLLSCGARAADLEWFLEHPCLPDVLGINYYVTSDRYLDRKVDPYPFSMHGGNGRHVYADCEAVRVASAGISGHRALLDELWQRYQLPLALTEVHIDCSRDEQLRWLLEAWQAACDARADGVDVRAVTAWALFGLVGWDELVTKAGGRYAPGVFDLRAPEPRPTALALALRALTRGGEYGSSIARTPGWWRRPDRVLYPAPARRTQPPQEKPAVQPLLITGAGTLGNAFARIAAERGISHALLSRGDLDIADADAARAVLDAHRPWAVINTAGFVRVDDAEREPDRCFRENVAGPLALARACQSNGSRFVTFSSDLVFNGRKQHAYVERDAPDPLSVYGRSKALCEEQVLAADPLALVIRTAAFFGPWDSSNFIAHVLHRLARGRRVHAPSDVISPTYVPDLVHATLDLLIDEESGLWHLANAGALSWAELARDVASRFGYDARNVHAHSLHAPGQLASRPRFSALGSERAQLLPALERALAAFETARVSEAAVPVRT
jgi:dTDP-4-dehydrorhamnose reductase